LQIRHGNRHEIRRDGKKTRFGIGVASRYSAGVMKVADIAALPVHKICEPDALLFLWATWPTIHDALAVMDGWGFQFGTCAFVWEKLYASGDTFCGAGRYTFSNTEFILVGRRGPLWHPKTGWKPRQVHRCEHPKSEDGKIIHSRKPYWFADQIQKWLIPYAEGGEFVELFATERRLGWIGTGHEIDGRDVKYMLPELEMKMVVNF
jgi:N6-adenosine-specific RNA methylase IME4